MRRQLLLIAKAPVPGRVKTRLCPPCTPEQAAAVAAAALADTLAALSATPAVRRTLVVHGAYPAPPGWHVVPQRGHGLGERLANAFADTAQPGVATLLVGMDTPQLSLLDSPPGNALGMAEDGGWWALQLENPADASVLPAVPMSTSDTGALTLTALQQRGLSMARLPVLRDVDTAEDALAVAALCPNSRFSRAVHAMVPSPERGPVTAPVALFGAALRRAARGDGASLTLLDRRGAQLREYDAGTWSADRRAGDGSLVDRCRPYTIDLGCGPGRLAAALATAGRPVLGVDISPQAVRYTRRRGAPALLADALRPLPGEGRWHSALLADGNIGIGGDPVQLLRRTRRLLRPGGRLLVEVDPPGHRSWQGDVALSDGHRVSDAFAWAFVGADQIAAIAAAAGLRVLEHWTEAGRWFVDLRD